VTHPLSRRRLELVPAGGVSTPLLERLRPELEARFGMDSAVGAPLPLEAEWVDAKTGRVRSDAVVDALLARADGEEGGGLRLALAEAELMAPGQQRVFGEAAVGGGCAVVGLVALRPAKPDDSPLYLSRVVKEAVHELAHAAGLEHCADPSCVMYPSRDIEDTDRKGCDFCAGCRGLFSHATLDAAHT
jgi:archaemetzincin